MAAPAPHNGTHAAASDEDGATAASSATAFSLPPVVRHFLRQEYHLVDPELPQLLGVLSQASATTGRSLPRCQRGQTCPCQLPPLPPCRHCCFTAAAALCLPADARQR